MLVTEGAGLPLGLHLDIAQEAEVRLAQSALETVGVLPPRDRPRTRHAHLIADKGYDSCSFGRYPQGRGIGHTIPLIGRRGRRRQGRAVQADPVCYGTHWVIERGTAWLQNLRKVLVRHERLLTTYRAFLLLACVMITLGALLE